MSLEHKQTIVEVLSWHEDLEIGRWGPDRAEEYLEAYVQARIAAQVPNPYPEGKVDLNRPCCDLHGRNCETPWELCCIHCTEAHHPAHLDGSVCSNPDLSRGRDIFPTNR